MNSLLSFVYTSLFVDLCISSVYCYSTGAGFRSCDDMFPKHGVKPSTDQNPYKLSFEVENGEKLKIALTAPQDRQFKGFFIQVRGKDNQDKIVGTFSIPVGSSSLIKTIKCHKEEKSAITHADAREKRNVEVEWRAPPGNGTVGEYQVYYTVVQDKNTLWTKFRSDSFNISSVPTPPSTAPTFVTPSISTSTFSISSSSAHYISILTIIVIPVMISNIS